VSAEVWDTYFKFCFERNPWDKLLSWYLYYYKTSKLNGSITDFIRSGRAGRNVGFDLYSINGWPVVDRVYLFEEMEHALNDISKRIGLSQPLTLDGIQAKKGKRKSTNLREVYTDQEIEMVRKMYAREIAFFGYDFPQTK
jgi:hypothetical protein